MTRTARRRGSTGWCCKIELNIRPVSGCRFRRQPDGGPTYEVYNKGFLAGTGAWARRRRRAGDIRPGRRAGAGRGPAAAVVHQLHGGSDADGEVRDRLSRRATDALAALDAKLARRLDAGRNGNGGWRARGGPGRPVHRVQRGEFVGQQSACVPLHGQRARRRVRRARPSRRGGIPTGRHGQSRAVQFLPAAGAGRCQRVAGGDRLHCRDTHDGDVPLRAARRGHALFAAVATDIPLRRVAAFARHRGGFGRWRAGGGSRRPGDRLSGGSVEHDPDLFLHGACAGRD